MTEVVREIEFVENTDPQGCFGAGMQALTGYDQMLVNDALLHSGLYDPDEGVNPMCGDVFTKAFQDHHLQIRLQEVLPFFNWFDGDEVAMDDSPAAVETRLKALQTALEQDDIRGVQLFFACQRTPESPPFGHFDAVSSVADTPAGPVFTIMDPGEGLNPKTGKPFGGVFEITADAMRAMLTPDVENGIPVCAYSVQLTQ